ncbi:unnamed protein product [Ixodes persulcatus]
MKQISSDAKNKSYDVSSPGQRIRISAPCFNRSSTRMLWLLIWCSSISFLGPVSSTTTIRPVGTSTASETTFRPDLSTRDVDEDLAVVFQDLDDKLLPLVARIKHDKGISGECQLAMLKTTFAARSGDTWALKLVTANGFFPNGMYEGGFANLGSRDQCLHTDSAMGIKGRYCTLFWRPNTDYLLKVFPVTDQHDPRQDIRRWLNNTRERFHVGMRSGICVPSPCQEQDMDRLASSFASIYGASAFVRYCEVAEDSSKLKPLERGIIIFFSTMVGIVVLSTITELILKWSSTEGTKRRVPVWKRALVSYSAVTNTKKLLDLSTPSSDSKRLRFLHGVKCLSVLWVVMAHAYYCIQPDAIDSVFRAVESTESFHFQVVANGFLCVSTFFFVSGFLLSYTMLKRRESLIKTSPLPQVAIPILRRFVRTTIPAMVVILALLLMPCFVKGPVAQQLLSKYYDGCSKNWWTVLLHINNFNRYEDICLDHYWYISTDMQLFATAVIICVLMTRHVKLGVALLIILSIACAIVVFVQTFVNNYQPLILFWNPDFDKSTETGEKIYALPFVHAGSFFIGVLCGLFTLNRGSLHIAKPIQGFLWTVSLACMTFMVFCSWPWNNMKLPSRTGSALYSPLHKDAWALSLFWITFACATGRGGIVNGFLSWRAFVVPSRLTYSVYLIHYLVYLARSGVSTVPLQLHEFLQFKDFLGVAVLSYLLGYLLYLIAEAPTANIEKILLGGRKEGVEAKASAIRAPDAENGKIRADCVPNLESQSKL